MVRISPRELSFINKEVWNDVYGKRSGVYEKDPAVYMKPPNKVDSLLSANSKNHARMRKVLNHAFSDRAFREYQPVVDGYTNLLISRWYEQIQEDAARVNVLEWYSWTAFDIIGDLTFGDKFECLQNKKLHPWVESSCSVLELLIYHGAITRFDLLRGALPLLIPKQIKQIVADNWTTTTEKVRRRLELGTRKPDFMSEILKFNDDKLGLSLDEIQSNSNLFIIAGSDSITSVLTCTTFHLLQNPAVMKMLTDEVCGAFKSQAEINGQSVSELPCLIACLDESLRIYPTSLTGQAVIVPSEGDTIGNE